MSQNEINLIRAILFIIVIHWIADFVFQTDWQAKNKSTSWNALLAHTAIYSVIWFFPALFLLDFKIIALLFVAITFVLHTITDFYTSRVNSQYYKDNKIHEFFVSVGFDQVLHYFQLILTYYFIKKL